MPGKQGGIAATDFDCLDLAVIAVDHGDARLTLVNSPVTIHILGCLLHQPVGAYVADRPLEQCAVAAAALDSLRCAAIGILNLCDRLNLFKSTLTIAVDLDRGAQPVSTCCGDLPREDRAIAAELQSGLDDLVSRILDHRGGLVGYAIAIGINGF